MANKSTRKTDYKKKQWYNIIAPDMFNQIVIGETLAVEPKKLIGRTVETTVGELINDLSKQNIKLKFKIDKVSGDSAYTKFIGHQLTHAYIHSLVKRKTSRIDTNVNVKTQDGYTVRVKPSCFTMKRARTSQTKQIRKIMKEFIIKRASELELSKFLEESVNGKLAANIFKEVKNIYPPRRVEIRKTEIK
ncbi:MAG: 30S ribosomal protein S3ae [Methanosarcinales archaeon]